MSEELNPPCFECEHALYIGEGYTCCSVKDYKFVIDSWTYCGPYECDDFKKEEE